MNLMGLWDLNNIPVKLKKLQTEKDKNLALKATAGSWCQM